MKNKETKNFEKEADLDGDIELNIIDKSYPYAKLGVSYFHSLYGKSGRHSSKKKTAVYNMLYFFGKHLEKNKVPLPCKADLFNFLVTSKPSLEDIEVGVPAICGFIKYCEGYKNELFGGKFKGWTIRRVFVFNGDSLFKKYYDHATNEIPSKGFSYRIYEENEYCPEIEEFDNE